VWRGGSGGSRSPTWLIQNLGTEAIYVARTADAATAATGVEVGAFQAVEFRLSTAGISSIFAATATGTADVRVIKSN
jgi:hypothetical protein